MIYALMPEPYENRPFYQWPIWISEIFGYDAKLIIPEYGVTNEKEWWSFEDAFRYRSEQLMELFREIDEGDIVFALDGEFPGLEMIEYYRKLAKKDVKVYSVWHAGTYDYYDLTTQRGLGRIGSLMEIVLFDICENVFVGTNFHKELIVKNRLVRDNIMVTGLPIDVYDLARYESKRKKWDVMFGGRLAYEKGYDIVAKLFPILENEYGLKCCIAMKMKWSKEEWYENLGMSKLLISPARQETFGYSVVEGMAMNVNVMVTNGLAYDDYVPKTNMFAIEDFTAENVVKMLDMDVGDMRRYVEKYHYYDVVKKWYEVITNDDVC